MAKELPYFKFDAAEWINGSITLESYSAQGLFINICSHYWFKSGLLSLSEIKRRLSSGLSDDFESLIRNDIIHIVDGMIKIKFLDEQLSERYEVSRINSANGRKGGRPKTENKPTALISVSEKKANESNIEEKREEKKRIELTFDLFWNKYDKKVGIQKSRALWDKVPESEHEKIMKHLDEYVKTERTYRKDPERYLKHRCWEDEIVTKDDNGGLQQWGKVDHIRI